MSANKIEKIAKSAYALYVMDNGDEPTLILLYHSVDVVDDAALELNAFLKTKTLCYMSGIT